MYVFVLYIKSEFGLILIYTNKSNKIIKETWKDIKQTLKLNIKKLKRYNM